MLGSWKFIGLRRAGSAIDGGAARDVSSNQIFMCEIRIFPAESRDEASVHGLCRVWERSVRATHTFLSDAEIGMISRCVPEFICAVPHLIVATDAVGQAVAFMGISGRKIEMLFVDPALRGQGVGRRLVEYGIRMFSVGELCVNEQNPQAVGFYEHLGFRVCRRSERDEQGNPYPILWMERSGEPL